MSVYAIDPSDILKDLKGCGLIGGPFFNFFGNYTCDFIDPKELVDALRLLEKNGYIKMNGPRTLNDLAAIIEDKSASLLTVEQQQADAALEGSERNQGILFPDGDDGFFETSIRLTLRGHRDLFVGKITLSKEPDPVPVDALQKLNEKRQAEKDAKEAARPINTFMHVVNILACDAERWSRDTKYWRKEEHDAHAVHLRLMESNPQYKEAFNTYQAAANKMFDDTKDDKWTDGTWRARIVENPFTRTLLQMGFNVLAHPFAARKFKQSHETILKTYQEDQAKNNAPKTPGLGN